MFQRRPGTMPSSYLKSVLAPIRGVRIERGNSKGQSQFSHSSHKFRFLARKYEWGLAFLSIEFEHRDMSVLDLWERTFETPVTSTLGRSERGKDLVRRVISLMTGQERCLAFGDARDRCEAGGSENVVKRFVLRSRGGGLGEDVQD